MGIGLSICKTIIKAHGGDIKAKNLDIGSEFYFDLPAEKEDMSYDAESISSDY